MSAVTAPLCIIANTDISGVGVRVATYFPNFLTLLIVFLALRDGIISVKEMDAAKTQSTTILLTAFSLLFAAIIGARTGAIDNYHAALVLNLSWMNNTNTFAYLLLFLHRKLYEDTPELTIGSPALNQPSSDFYKLFKIFQDWIHQVWRQVYSTKAPPAAPFAVVPIVDNAFTFQQHWQHARRWIQETAHLFDPVLTIGSFHLSIMAALGLWLWSDPGNFGTSAPCSLTVSLYIFHKHIQLGNQILRVISLAVYGLIVLPGLNLVLPILVICLPYYLRSRWIPRWLLKLQGPNIMFAGKTASIVGISWSLMLLTIVNAVFVTETELAIHWNNMQEQTGDSQWTFGQTLAMLLLLLPLRDAIAGQRLESRWKALHHLETFNPEIHWTWHQIENEIDNLPSYQKVHCAPDWLLEAAKAGNDKVVRFAIEHNVQLDYNDLEGFTALERATQAQNPSIIQLLLDAHAPVTNTVPVHHAASWKPALHYAVQNTDQVLVNRYLALGADPSELDASGNTAFLLALNLRQLAMIEAFAKAGHSVDIKAKEDLTTLHLAAILGLEEAVAILFHHGARLWIDDNDGNTALHHAARTGHTNTVNLLLKFHNFVKDEANKSKSDESYSQARIIKFLQIDDFLDRHNNRDQTPLHLASSAGHASTVKALKDAGARIDELDQFWWTPLHYAAHYGDLECVQYLVSERIDAQSAQGFTPLHLASLKGHIDVVEWLLGRGARLDITDGKHWNALHFAVRGGNAAVCQLLASKIGDINQVSENGTALYLAAIEGRIEIVRILLGASAHVNVETDKSHPLLERMYFKREQSLKHIPEARGIPVEVYNQIIELLKANTDQT